MTKEQTSELLRAVTLIADSNTHEVAVAMRAWSMRVRLGAAYALRELADEVRAAAIRGD